MDTTALEAQLATLVPQLLDSGDPAWLTALSADERQTALEAELRFFGIYPPGDTATPAAMRQILTRRLPQWWAEAHPGDPTMSEDPITYHTLPPLRQHLYREYTSKHGVEPRTLAELDEVADVLYTAGVHLAAQHDLDREEVHHATAE